MMDIFALSRIVEISRRRLDAARAALAAAEAALRAAETTVTARIAEAEELSARKSQLKAEAEIAFFKSPQTAMAVMQLIENNTAYDKKARDAWTRVEEARAVVVERRTTRDAARNTYAKLARECDARDSLHQRLSRSAARKRELRLETAMNDDRAVLLRKEHMHD